MQAKELFIRDVNYIIKGGEIIIVDEFTGRTMAGRRWSDGLHQARRRDLLFGRGWQCLQVQPLGRLRSQEQAYLNQNTHSNTQKRKSQHTHTHTHTQFGNAPGC